MSFYNTTGETGEQLKDYQEKAKTQDQIILEIFQKEAERGKYFLSPSEVWAWMSKTPITSIRRSMTTLAKQEKLKKTTKRVKGIYGRPEHCWKLA